MWCLALVCSLQVDRKRWLNPSSVEGGGLVAQLMTINIILVLFNLLPAFPMDGGRVLRALLATRLSYARATQVRANVGQGFALSLVSSVCFGIRFSSSSRFSFISVRLRKRPWRR